MYLPDDLKTKAELSSVPQMTQPNNVIHQVMKSKVYKQEVSLKGFSQSQKTSGQTLCGEAAGRTKWSLYLILVFTPCSGIFIELMMIT